MLSPIEIDQIMTQKHVLCFKYSINSNYGIQMHFQMFLVFASGK